MVSETTFSATVIMACGTRSLAWSPAGSQPAVIATATKEEPPQNAQPASGGASEEPDPGPSLDEILSKIRQRGRRYEAGTVVLTFHELLTLLAPDEPAEEAQSGAAPGTGTAPVGAGDQAGDEGTRREN